MAANEALHKIPAVTLGFWIVKIAATTLGETGGDAVTMTLHVGYLIGTIVFTIALLVAVGAQIGAKRFHPWLYWAAIVATTTTGTTLADFCDRSLGIGYLGGSSLLFAALLGTLGLWYLATGSVASASVTSRKAEAFYWATIMFSQTLGTALGDCLADTGGLGFGGGAAVFGTALGIVALLYYRTAVSRTALFWAAFILTRPLGATLGDLLDKPPALGGFNLDRFEASGVLIAAMAILLLTIPQRAGAHPGTT